MPEAFAAVREAARRVLGQRAFRVQLVGAAVMHQDRIAEMRTGEGKTLTAAIAAYLNALPGKGVHVVTVNDYLAKYHSEWMGKVYRFMGLTVGLILHDMEPDERQAAYNSDITYATNNELGFDYLRDNMVVQKERMVQRPLNFAIVDEVDSILIDEARTPLIISGQGEKSTELYQLADRFVSRLREGEENDYIRDEKEKTIILTEEGVRKAEAAFNIENLTDSQNTELHHHILAALRANVMMKRDVDYVVKDGQVVIVDEFTGRLMTGRRYSDGLHQAIEAKEHVKVERESKTLATITFQNYFRMYKKISGMTGTAKTEEEEFRGIYKLDVVTIPTNRPMIRKDMNDAIYTTVKGKFEAVADEVERRHATGQPVLVGTVSVEKSEYVSKLLEKRGVKHVVLNAKFHEREAEIVAQAGKKGAVTISTNMAGRGTDILLGGNAEFMAKHEMRRQGYEDAVIEEAVGHNENVPDEVKEARKLYKELYAKFSKETEKEHEEVIKLGGLHIIGTERHESRRIDNQLRGRAGRQGDPGSSQFFISLQDDLMRLFGSDRIQPMIQRLGLSESDKIEYGILSKQIENSQKRVEGRNFEIRKNVLQYDDVMNRQREIIYGQRNQVLEGEDIHDTIMKMVEQTVEGMVETYLVGEPKDWNIVGLKEYYNGWLITEEGTPQFFGGDVKSMRKAEVTDLLLNRAKALYRENEELVAEETMREMERVYLLKSVDTYWMEHIDNMEELKQGIRMRAYAQKDPVVEFRLEGFDMFDQMIESIRQDTVKLMIIAPKKVREIQKKQEEMERMRIEAEKAAAAAHQVNLNKEDAPKVNPVTFAIKREQVAKPTEFAGDGTLSTNRTVVKGKKVGRNDPCPCGSGKKYKKCCGQES